VFNKNLSRFQRRSLQIFGASILFIAALTLLTRDCFTHSHPTGALAWLLAMLPSLPFLGTVLIAMRYLARETDEFIRTQVRFALLQGSVITLAITVIYAFLQNFLKISDPPAMAYVDLFLIASMFALRFHLRSSQ
jgi:hypothetical protein